MILNHLYVTPAVTAESLFGVWRRRSLRLPDGSHDTTSVVFWIQARPHFADVRLPATRPSFAGVDSLAGCTPEQRAALADQQGFAGVLGSGDGVWEWTRWLDYQPFGGRRDAGRLRFADADGRILVEDGAESSYTEIWERVDDGASSDGEALVLQLEWQTDLADARTEPRQGLLVALGNHFLLALDRPGRVPAGPSLADVLAAGGPNAALPMLDMELSFGQRVTAGGARWIVSHSTLPWREDRPAIDPAAMRFDPAARTIEQDLSGARRLWRVREPTAGRVHWFASPAPSPEPTVNRSDIRRVPPALHA